MTAPKILFLGEAYGQNEAKINSCFVGSSGVELLRMCNEVGIIEFTASDFDYINKFYNYSDPTQIDAMWNLHPEIARTNVFMLQPQGNKIETLCGDKKQGIVGYGPIAKSKYVLERYLPELERLSDLLVDLNPNLIVALGNTALWAMCNTTGVAKVRGTTIQSTHCVEGFKILPTYHPAAILRQWENRPIVLADLIKAKYEAEYPEIRRPKREIWIEPDVIDIEFFIANYIKTGCSILSVDIETSGEQITCIGLAPTIDRVIVIPFHDNRKSKRSYWPDRATECFVWELIRPILADPTLPKVFQNGLYDIAFLWRSYGIQVYGATHDTMLLHHALQPEMLKGLGFLGSIYTNESAWKNERKGITTIKRDD